MTDKKQKVSIVMAAYNAAEYLAAAIDSILAQTFTDFECLIIEDGSTDSTLDMLRQYAARDERIKLIIHQKNQGLIASLNDGFRAAKGEYIARMDADDILFPERLQEQYEYMETHSDTVVLGTQAVFMDDDGSIYGIETFLLHDEELRVEMALKGGQFRHGAMMIRASVVRGHDLYYDDSAVYYEDYEYWTRLMRYGRGENLPEVLYYYRKSNTSITATRRPQMVAGTALVRSREYELLKLPAFGVGGFVRTLRVARNYGPASVVIDGKRLATGLHWMYQSYAFSVAKLYLRRREYMSGAWCLLACIVMQPFKFVWEGARIAWQKVA